MFDDKLIYLRLPFLKDARRFFVFARIWWDGTGFDSVVVWQDGDNVRQQMLRTGETTVFKEADIISQKQLSSAEFADLVAELNSTGWIDAPSQLERIWLTHYDYVFGAKLAGPKEPHWMFVRGGRHSDLRAINLLEKVREYYPDIF